MENKDLDSLLNELNGELNPEETTSPSGDSSVAFDNITSTLSENNQDAILREMLSGYNPTNSVEGWAKIAASLDSADEAFDHGVRNRIHHYHASYDPHSWPKFTKRFTDHKQLRTRLIVLKLSEAAAILLLVLTMLHLGHEGRLPFQESNAEQLAAHSAQIVPAQTPAAVLQHTDPEITVQLNTTIEAEIHSMIKQASTAIEIITNRNAVDQAIMDNPTQAFASDISTSANADLVPAPHSLLSENKTSGSLAADFPAKQTTMENSDFPRSNFDPAIQLTPLSTSSLSYVVRNTIQKPTLVAASGRTYVEFGMLAQADYNQLKMPEDRLNNDGEQIVFPLQGITSPGYGAGFTLALGHPRWAAETGVIYNAKTFRPGRELTIGTEADNSNIEYEAMHMQLVSIPLQFRYRFDVKGRLKTYGFAGFGLHIIAQSDIDVMVDHNFPSLAAGEDPNNNPSLARTIRQAQRVSEDIRDRALFSTNSYISANLGLGVEYEVVERKTLFLQTAYQYQIPNIRFSNHNGKHVLSLSLQAGVRTPLGS